MRVSHRPAGTRALTRPNGYLPLRFASLTRLLALSVTTAFLAACGANGSSGTSPIPGTAAPLTQSAARTVSALATPTPTPTPNPCYCPPRHICSDIACLAQPQSPANVAMPAGARVAAPLAATPTPTPTHDPCYCPPTQRYCPAIACQINASAPSGAAIESRSATELKRTGTP
jgi:hypothetical protein